MDKQIGWYKESEDKFLCNDCFKTETIRDAYVPIKEEGLKKDIYTCDKCGKVMDQNISNVETKLPIKTKIAAWWIRILGIIFIPFSLYSFFYGGWIATLVVLIFGILLIFLSQSLFKKEKRAWMITIALWVISIILSPLALFVFIFGAFSSRILGLISGPSIPFMLLPFLLAPSAILLLLDRENLWGVATHSQRKKIDRRGMATASLILGIFTTILIWGHKSELIVEIFKDRTFSASCFMFSSLFSSIGMFLGIKGLKSTKKNLAILGFLLCTINLLIFLAYMILGSLFGY